ncbi:MAG: hypothetical protein ACI3XT_03245, partial [Butyricicoccaceae bacterium]
RASALLRTAGFPAPIFGDLFAGNLWNLRGPQEDPQNPRASALLRTAGFPAPIFGDPFAGNLWNLRGPQEDPQDPLGEMHLPYLK